MHVYACHDRAIYTHTRVRALGSLVSREGRRTSGPPPEQLPDHPPNGTEDDDSDDILSQQTNPAFKPAPALLPLEAAQRDLVGGEGLAAREAPVGNEHPGPIIITRSRKQ